MVKEVESKLSNWHDCPKVHCVYGDKFVPPSRFQRRAVIALLCRAVEAHGMDMRYALRLCFQKGRVDQLNSFIRWQGKRQLRSDDVFYHS